MRLLTSIFLLTAVLLPAQSSDEKDAVAVVQQLFDGMAAHDGATIRLTMLPEARIYAVRDSGATNSVAGADFAGQIETIKGKLLERFTDPPHVLIRGRMAEVWGEYEFLRDDKFNHCGVDNASLLKTTDGWKIATIVYTTETAGCKGQ